MKRLKQNFSDNINPIRIGELILANFFSLVFVSCGFATGIFEQAFAIGIYFLLAITSKVVFFASR